MAWTSRCKWAPTEKIENYFGVQKLGIGADGHPLYKIKHRVERDIFFMKAIPLKAGSERLEKKLKKQVSIMRKLEHDNILLWRDNFIVDGPVEVPLWMHGGEDEVGVCQPNGDRTFCLVYEYAEEGTLKEIIKQKKMDKTMKGMFTEEEIWKMLIQMTTALGWMHSGNVFMVDQLPKYIHRGLRPEIIIKNDYKNWLISDLSDAEDPQKQSPMSRGAEIDEMRYMAPEFLSGEKGKKYDNKIDMWALGCIMYEVMTLQPAFQYKGNINKLMEDITQNKPTPMNKTETYNQGVHFSEELQAAVMWMLRKDPRNRPSSLQMYAYIMGVYTKEDGEPRWDVDARCVPWVKTHIVADNQAIIFGGKKVEIEKKLERALEILKEATEDLPYVEKEQGGQEG